MAAAPHGTPHAHGTPHGTPQGTPQPQPCPEQRRAAHIVQLLTLYRPLLDAFVIDFFTEDLWAQLPAAWQPSLAGATPEQLAGLLGGRGDTGVAWPLSLLAFAAAARALALPRGCPRGSPRYPPCQSHQLHPLLRRHVKPKKQHEIQRLGKLLLRLSRATGCQRVVDVGAGQGHLSRFLAFGLGLGVTAVESDARLVGLARRFDQELLRELGKTRGSQPCPLTPRAPQHLAGRLDPAAPWGEFLLPPEPPGAGPAARNPLGGPGGSEDGGLVLLTGLHACGDLGPALLCHFARSPAVAAVALVGCCYMKLSTTLQQQPGYPPGYPLSASVAALPGHQLSYRAREAACHALEEFEGRLLEGSAHLRAHCYRAALESLIRATDPAKRHLGLQPGRKAHGLSFPQYAQLGLPLAGLDPAEFQLDSGAVRAMLEQQHKVVAFCTLGQLLAPVVETLILLDRLLYLREQGGHRRSSPHSFPLSLDPSLRSPNSALLFFPRFSLCPRASLQPSLLPEEPGVGGCTDPAGHGAGQGQ
ncbi:methyltransferase-like protein 25B isoform X1 [Taeniopygia guttata]|uniref:methyltransferase-like protein 25B isoform X1 n=1 Tax=Taeniopygia guttata TaxID=59729 RepID=UPI003BB8CB2D